MTHPQRLAALFDTAECQSAIEAAEPLRESSRQLAHRPLALALDLASYPALNLETYVIRAGKDAVVYIRNQKVASTTLAAGCTECHLKPGTPMRMSNRFRSSLRLFYGGDAQAGQSTICSCELAAVFKNRTYESALAAMRAARGSAIKRSETSAAERGSSTFRFSVVRNPIKAATSAYFEVDYGGHEICWPSTRPTWRPADMPALAGRGLARQPRSRPIAT